MPWPLFVSAFYDMLKIPLDVPSDQPLLDVPLGLNPDDSLMQQATMNRLEEYAMTSAEAYNRCLQEVFGSCCRANVGL